MYIYLYYFLRFLFWLWFTPVCLTSIFTVPLILASPPPQPFLLPPSIPPLSDLSEWRLRINRRLFHSNRNAYIWSLTPHGAVTESQVHKWATVICKELWRWRRWRWWGHMPTIMRVRASSKVGGQLCAHAHARRKKTHPQCQECASVWVR